MSFSLNQVDANLIALAFVRHRSICTMRFNKYWSLSNRGKSLFAVNLSCAFILLETFRQEQELYPGQIQPNWKTRIALLLVWWVESHFPNKRP